MKIQNKTLQIILLSFFFIQLIGCNETNEEAIRRAEVDLLGIQSTTDSTYLLTTNQAGNISFVQQDSIVTMTINLIGFTPNTSHAVHIHEGSCEAPQSHWNLGLPQTEKFCNVRSLDQPWAKPKAGDVGNVSVGTDGAGSLIIQTDLWRIGTNDDRDLLQKIVVIHESEQDFIEECDPLHDHIHAHNNPKVACGMIEAI